MLSIVIPTLNESQIELTRHYPVSLHELPLLLVLHDVGHFIDERFIIAEPFSR